MSEITNVAAYDLHTRIRSPIVLSLLGIQGGEKVLDVGSGTGYLAEHISKENSHTFCIDVALNNLHSITTRGKGTLVLVNARAEKLPLRNASFDKVLCTEVLEHMSEDKDALQEISRVLKPGGIVVITVPCSGFTFPSLMEWLGIKTVHDYEGPEKHYRKGYTVAELANSLGKNGMVVCEYVYFAHFFSKLVLDIVSLAHLVVRKVVMDQKSWDWSDIQDFSSSRTFAMYKVLFPLFLLISRLDRLFLFLPRARGSGLAVKSVKAFE